MKGKSGSAAEPIDPREGEIRDSLWMFGLIVLESTAARMPNDFLI